MTCHVIVEVPAGKAFELLGHLGNRSGVAHVQTDGQFRTLGVLLPALPAPRAVRS